MQESKYTVTKTYSNLPCAHRRWKHDGHCAFIHGYSRTATLVFKCSELDENDFVVDFGALKEVKKWMNDKFDHTLLLDQDDPLLPVFRDMEKKGACRLTVFKSVGMEGSAREVWKFVSGWLEEKYCGRVWLHSVEMRENDKNCATYYGS